MNSRHASPRQGKPIWVPIAALLACVVIVAKPQIIGTPLIAFSSWLGHKAAAQIQEDMEDRGIISTTSTTHP